jgi:hypothetical protein
MQNCVTEYTVEKKMIGYTILDKICDIILLIYPVLKPFYIFDSGMLQPADMFLMVGFFLLVISRKEANVRYQVVTKVYNTVLLYFSFTCYQFIINIVWFLLLAGTYYGTSSGLLKSSLFSLFNFFAILTCIMIYERIGHRMFVKIAQGFFLSSIVVFLLTVFSSAESIRSTAGFNNPNQLGYFGVLLLAGIIIFGKYLKSTSNIIAAGLSLVFIAASLSKAAILGALISIMLTVLVSGTRGYKINAKVKVFLFIILVFIIYMLLFDNTLYLKNPTLYAIRNRMDRIWIENDSSFADGRGYRRVLETGIHFLWGTGEGAYQRFVTMPGAEIHSSYMSVLVSYGVIGFLLLTKIITGMLFMDKYNKLVSVCLFSGVFLYWFTHQGLRNTIFWVLISVYMLMSHSDSENPAG